MSVAAEIVWLLAGLLLGLLLGFGLGLMRRKTKIQRAKLGLADSQQRRALERLSESNRELSAQLDAAAQRQSRTLAAMKKSHAAEVGALQTELANMRKYLMLHQLSDEDERPISSTSFANTQIGPDSQH
jgi:hypothetical protein